MIATIIYLSLVVGLIVYMIIQRRRTKKMIDDFNKSCEEISNKVSKGLDNHT